MISKKREILFVGYGTILAEGFVVLITACTIASGDYFAINTPASTYDTFLTANYTISPVNLGYFSEKIGISLQRRTGGTVFLAVGMAYIFGEIPFLENLMAWLIGIILPLCLRRYLFSPP